MTIITKELNENRNTKLGNRTLSWVTVVWPLCCVYGQQSVYPNVESCGLMFRRKCKAKVDVVSWGLKSLLDSYMMLSMLSASETTWIPVAVRIAYVFMVFHSVSTHTYIWIYGKTSTGIFVYVSIPTHNSKCPYFTLQAVQFFRVHN
jgi:hypothetical protein